MKVENTRSGIYHFVAEELGNNRFKTLCGRVVTAHKQYTGTERWIQEHDAWVCNCRTCNRIKKKENNNND